MRSSRAVMHQQTTQAAELDLHKILEGPYYRSGSLMAWVRRILAYLLEQHA